MSDNVEEESEKSGPLVSISAEDFFGLGRIVPHDVV